MITAPKPQNEADRIRALEEYEILDSEAERVFDDLTELASFICNTPISLVSLIDVNRQWFKSKVGLDARETPRELAFCAHAILQDELFVIPDSFEDERFRDNPLAVEAPNVRFYAGMPLKSRSGYNVGTLCVIDNQPRDLNEAQRDALVRLGRQIVSQMELRKNITEVSVLSKSLSQKNAELDKFAYIVSHDLKAPLRAIANLATWIKEDFSDSLPAEANDHLDRMSSRVTRLDNMIDGILSYSRAGKMDEDVSRVDLDVLAREVWASLGPPANAKLLLEKLPKIRAPKLGMEQIFQNILSNSIKHNDKDQLSVEISYRDHGPDIQISIKDNGPGIPEKFREKVFEVFQTLQARDQIESTGVGLSIVSKLVEKTCGQILIGGEEGEGAEFHLRWPKESIEKQSKIKATA